MNSEEKIVVFGAGGLIGGEIVTQLKLLGYDNVIASRHCTLDLINQKDVNSFFALEKPKYVFFCAVRAITDFESSKNVDGVEAYSNIMMQLNVMEACRIFDVEKAVFLGSAMLYPWNCDQQEERLSENLLENFGIKNYRASMQSTVLSKFLCMKMCEFYNLQYNTKFIYTIPTHIYGGFKGRKNLYFLENMVSSICDAKLSGASELYIDVFGEGKAKKQFLHVRDCADAIIAVMDKYEDYSAPINIASDVPESWSSITDLICDASGWHGVVKFNKEHKENMANRLCSTEKIMSLGWRQKISMCEGIRELVDEYMSMKGRSAK